MIYLPNLQRLVGESLPDELPSVLPAGWERLEDHKIAGHCAVFGHTNGLVVLYSKSADSETGEWLHLSVSWKGGPPDWSQVMLVKRIFWGAKSEALQVIPSEEDHVNLAHCWHIWKRP